MASIAKKLFDAGKKQLAKTIEKGMRGKDPRKVGEKLGKRVGEKIGKAVGLPQAKKPQRKSDLPQRTSGKGNRTANAAAWLGRQAAGIPKNLTAEQRDLRSAQMGYARTFRH